MWSGPRNISTAMMRSWESRPDTVVVDEPFYAHYLERTGAGHPGRDEILAAQPTDPDLVIHRLLAPIPDPASVFYQKHMTHHMLPSIDLSWLDRVVNCFLILDPAEVIASYLKVMGKVTTEDIGLARQAELFDLVRDVTGAAPPVLDSADVLRDPARAIRALCDAVDVPFDEAMLSWAPGPRESDGVWAPHWYANVERSTGFAPYTPRETAVPPEFQPVLDECRPLYERLAQHRLLR